MILHHTVKMAPPPPMTPSPLPRRERLTREQITARRHEDWRIAHDEGARNELGKFERRSVSEIAALYRVTPQAVRDGIKRARLIRTLIQGRVEGFDGDVAAN